MTTTFRPADLRKLAALVAMGLAAFGVQALEMRGFRGISWGDGVEYLGQAELLSTQGEVKCYKRDRENLMFGDSTLNEVRYCFHRDQLFLVTLGASVDQQALQNEFQRTYGAPDVRHERRAEWGSRHHGGMRAELVPLGAGRSSLTLLSNRFDPSLGAHARQPAGTPSTNSTDL